MKERRRGESNEGPRVEGEGRGSCLEVVVVVVAVAGQEG